MAKQTYIGNLVRDLEPRFSDKTGKAYTFNALKVRDRVRQEDGSWTDGEPKFFNLVAFGDLAERLCGSCEKGDRVIVVGEERDGRPYVKDGEEITPREIVVDEIGVSLRFNYVTVERT